MAHLASKSRRKISFLRVTLAGIALVVAVSLVVLALRVRQERLDAALLEAVFDDKRARALELLAQGASPNATDYQPLTDAPRGIWARLHGKESGHHSAPDHTVLSIAVYNQNVAMVSELLRRGADPNLRLQDGDTVISYTRGWKAGNPSIEQIRRLLKQAGASE